MKENLKVIRGVAITPPIIGRITMGHIELRTGGGKEDKAIPKKDDFFGVTTLVQGDDREWIPHPLEEKLIGANEKLRAIPVRIAYNDPRLTLHNSYSCFDPKTARVLCAGDGEKARRSTEGGVMEIECTRPEACEFAQRNRCKNMSRVYLQIDGQDDELGTFVLRSTSWNTLKSIAVRLAQLHGLTGGKMAGIPLMLKMRAKSTTQSFRRPIYYADLVVRPGATLFQAIEAGKEYQKKLLDAGLDQENMEAAMLAGIANGDFADEIEDIDEWMSDEEFVAQVDQGLRKRGLNGLDSLAKSAAATPSASSETSPAEAETVAVAPTTAPGGAPPLPAHVPTVVGPPLALNLPKNTSAPDPVHQAA